MKPNIIFFGTPDFGVTILKKLVENDFSPSLIVTVPDQPEGRDQALAPPAVKVEALEQGIPVSQPEKVSEIEQYIKELSPDLIVLAAYGHIIPSSVLAIPPKGSLNVHPSMLPLFRGSSPVQTAILQGAETTGVSIMLMDEKIDHGPILLQKELATPLSSLSYTKAKEELAQLGGDLLAQVIPQWIEGSLTPTDQDHTKATTTEQLTRDDGKIDWTTSAEEIERKVRALNPWPGTFTFANEKRMKIIDAQILEGIPQRPVGSTYAGPDGTIAVVTATDTLLISELQLEGKKAMKSKEFLLGNTDFIGTVLK